MGSGSWSTSTYNAAATYRSAKGIKTFAYSDSGNRQTHVTLDPASLGAAGVRESRDSAEHPLSTALMIITDVTGSMGKVPRILQETLPELYDMLVDKGYTTDPQILFGAVGDAKYDRAPLQISQFESDNRSEEHLRNIVIEGGGGGGIQESYELALYFAARKTSIDCIESREKKGYLFIIGDEKAYDVVNATEVKNLIGDDIGGGISTVDILAEAQEMYHVFYLLPQGAYHAAAAYGAAEVLKYWKNLLGQNVIEVTDLNKICEIIAATIGLTEGTATHEDMKDALSPSTQAAVSQLI